MKVNVIENMAVTLTDEFLKGDYFSKELSRKVINLIDPVNDSTYDEVLNSVKIILNKANKADYYNIFVFKTDTPLTTKEKALFIRMINLAHKNADFFIVLNNDIIFVPDKYRNENKFDVEKYIQTTTNSISGKQKYIKFKNKIRSFFTFYQKSSVIKKLIKMVYYMERITVK